jgi:hypothetical protein
MKNFLNVNTRGTHSYHCALNVYAHDECAVGRGALSPYESEICPFLGITHRYKRPLRHTLNVVCSACRKMTGMFKSRGTRMSKILSKVEKVRIYIKAHLCSLPLAM